MEHSLDSGRHGHSPQRRPAWAPYQWLGVRTLVVRLLMTCCTVVFSGAGATDQHTYQRDPLSTARSPQDRSALAEFGRTLFFDTRLSADGTVGCVTCHQPERAFTDGKAVAEGLHGRLGTRNTPSLLNAAYADPQFWDGRRRSLEAQVLDPFVNPIEHGLQDQQALLTLLRQNRDYASLCQKALGKSVDHLALLDVAKALAAHIQSLKPTDTRLERYLFRHDASALDPTEQRGLALFRGRAQCATCHHIGEQAAPLTDGQYHSLAIGLDHLGPRLASLTKRVAKTPRADVERLVSTDADIAALGRFVITLVPADIGAFKTPSLYAVAATAPYMHDGSIATLEGALDRELYYRGRDLGYPVVLSVTERADLLAFLQAVGDVPSKKRSR